jgi:hypothetical protein
MHGVILVARRGGGMRCQTAPWGKVWFISTRPCCTHACSRLLSCSVTTDDQQTLHFWGASDTTARFPQTASHILITLICVALGRTRKCQADQIRSDDRRLKLPRRGDEACICISDGSERASSSRSASETPRRTWREADAL